MLWRNVINFRPTEVNKHLKIWSLFSWQVTLIKASLSGTLQLNFVVTLLTCGQQFRRHQPNNNISCFSKFTILSCCHFGWALSNFETLVLKLRNFLMNKGPYLVRTIKTFSIKVNCKLCNLRDGWIEILKLKLKKSHNNSIYYFNEIKNNKLNKTQ